MLPQARAGAQFYRRSDGQCEACIEMCGGFRSVATEAFVVLRRLKRSLYWCSAVMSLGSRNVASSGFVTFHMADSDGVLQWMSSARNYSLYFLQPTGEYEEKGISTRQKLSTVSSTSSSLKLF